MKQQDNNITKVYRGEIYLVDLGQKIGSEQGGLRPVLIIQNDIGNKYSPTTIVATITSKQNKNNIPTHFKLHSKECGIKKDSMVLFEQILTIDKRRLLKKVGQVNKDIINKLNNALKISLDV